MAQISRILDAEIIPEPESDEKRAEVAERVRQWVRERQPGNEKSKPLTEEEFDAWAAKFRETLRGTHPLSSLAKSAAGMIDAASERRQQPDMDGREDAPEHAEVRS